MAFRYLIYRTDFGNTIVRETPTDTSTGGTEVALFTDFVIPEIQPLYLWRVTGGTDVVPNLDSNINAWLDEIAPPPEPEDNATVGFVTGETENKIDIVTGATNQVPIFNASGNLDSSGYTIDQLTGGTGGGVSDETFTGYTATTDTRLIGIESDISTISGQTENKIDKVLGATGNVGVFLGDGNLEDSGFSIDELTGSTDSVSIETFTGYTATTDTRLQGIESDIVSVSGQSDQNSSDIAYLSGQTDLKLNISDFNSYSAATDTRISDNETDISTLFAAANSSITGATNGLTKLGQNVELGGTLDKDTILSGITSDFRVYSADITLQANGNVDIIDANGNGIDVESDGGSIDIIGNTSLGAETTKLTISDSQLLITDSRGTATGLQYAADYSTNFTSRSLVDKSYVDSVGSGLTPKASVDVASTANVDLTGSTFGGSIDGESILNGWRVLIKDQTNPVENGIYDYISGSNTFVRSSDFDGTPNGEISDGNIIPVVSGATQYNSIWVLVTPNPISVDVTPLEFTLFSVPHELIAGVGIDINGNTISVDGASLEGSSITFSGNTFNVDTASGNVATALGLKLDTTVFGAYTANTINTANNGLTKIGDNVTLGGTLTGDTSINLDGNLLVITGNTSASLTIGDNSFVGVSCANLLNRRASIGLIDDTVYLGRENESTGDQQGFFATGGLGLFISDDINSRGVIYADDYSANYNNRSLVDKEYVDSTTVSNDIFTGYTATTETRLEGIEDDITGLTATSYVNYVGVSDIYKLDPTSDGMELKLGVDTSFPVVNNTSQNVTALDPKVFMILPGSGVTSGDTITQGKSILVTAEDITNGAVYGLNATPALSGDTFKLQTYGVLLNVNTSMWESGTQLYVDADDPGKLTDSKSSEAPIWLVGKVGRSSSTEGTILLNTIIGAKSISDTIPNLYNKLIFTADKTVTTGGTFFDGKLNDAGSTLVDYIIISGAGGNTGPQAGDFDVLGPIQEVNNEVERGEYFAQWYVDTYGSGTGDDRLFVEVYLADSGGTAIDSGVPLPNGSLGVAPITTLYSGVIDLSTSSGYQFADLKGLVSSAVTINTGQRIRFRLLAEKIGSDTPKSYQIEVGQSLRSLIKIPKRIELGDLGNVTLSNQQIGDLIQLGSDNIWENKSVSDVISGFTANEIFLIHTGGTELNTVAPTAIDWDISQVSGSSYSWTGGSDVTILESGDYEISYNIPFNSGDNSSKAIGANVVLNNSTVIDVTAAAATVNRNLAAGSVGVSTVIVSLSANDILTLATFRTSQSGSAVSSRDGTILIKKKGKLQ